MTTSNIPRHLFLTIPLMDESAHLPELTACLSKQTYPNFTAIFCVNQPDQWWNQPDKIAICYSNQSSLNFLKSDLGFPSIIIDKSSPGNGWKGKNFGVGMARKTAMDKAASLAVENDLIVMMDGDTYYPANYLSELCKTFDTHPHIKALSAPYYHRLTGQGNADLAVLRYEIYMRYYALNMMRTGNPYAFTAVGSAIACTGGAYSAVNGITPHKSGEDFYFFQKMRKFGSVMIWLDATVNPAARFSDRVFFGTGPAMIRGNAGDWSSYPIFPYHFFDEVAETFQKFNILFSNNAVTPMNNFLEEKFGQNFLESLRQNVKGEEKFTKACMQKVDGLRILQYLKWRIQHEKSPDEKNLSTFLQKFYPQAPILAFLKQKDFSFVKASVEQLDEIRNYLHQIESTCQKKIRILR